MLNQEKRTINGAEYVITQFGARLGLRLKIKLSRKLAGPLALLTQGKADAGDIAKSLTEGLAEDEELLDMVIQLLSGTTRNGKALDGNRFDVEFAGNYEELYQVLRAVVEVNYGGFLKSIGLDLM